jgi:carbonic anhydrase
MDARIDPVAFLGLANGDANVIRNAGGIVTDDVLRSLAISQRLLGTEEVLVVGHTDCGLHGLDEEKVGLEILLLSFDDLEERVRASVRTVRECPFLDLEAAGAVYDVHTGRIRPV